MITAPVGSGSGTYDEDDGTHDVTFYHDNTGYYNVDMYSQFYIADIDLIS